MNGILSGEKRDLPLLSLTPLILLVVLSIWSGGVFAAVCTSDSSGNWNAKDTWGTAATGCVGAPGGIPDANDDVIISAGHTVSLNGGNRDSRSFTIAATGQLDDDNRRLTINNNGNVVINGTWNGSGTLRKDGIGTLSGVGNVVGNVRFELRNTTTVLAGTNLTFTDTTNSRISISNGIVVTNNGTVTVAQMTGGNAASTWTNAANSTLNISRDLLTTGILNASAAGNTVNYNGAAQTVKLPSVSAGTPTYHHLTLSGSGAKTLLAGTLTINGNLTVVGAGVTYNGTTNNPVINLKENFSNSGTFNSGTGVFTFNGTTAQSLTGATTFTNMTMNNATGLTINNNVTVSSVLNLTSGNITTGTNILIMTPNCNTAGAVVRGIGGGHVFGNLRKPVPTGTPITCTWEVGGTTNYAPVTNTFASVTTAGTLTVRTDDGDHTDTASGIGGSCSVNRYWTLTPATMVVSTYSPTFTFVNPGDLDSGVDPTSTNFIVSKKNAGTWILPTMGTRTATSTQATGITNAQGFGEFVLGYTAATCFNHFAISHSGSAVNCQAEDITVAVHDVTHAIATSYTGTITLSTSTGKGDWSVVTGSGTLVNGTADDGAATYTFVAADNGDVVLGLKDTVAETVNINITNGTITEASGTATAAEDAILVFAASGFRITDGGAPPAAASIAPQTAGVTSVTYGLQAIRTDTSTGACVGAFASGTDVTVDLASQCNNPITCIVGQNVAITNNAVTANIASNPNSGVVSYTARSLRFGANSQALFTLSYPDAGSISLHARYNIPLGSGGPSSTNMMGSSNTFVVKPYGFVLSNIQATTLAGRCTVNPDSVPACALDATGARFAKAGEDFSATVTATQFNGSATPNYGNEISAEGVRLTSNIVLPALGVNPLLTNASVFGSFSSGVATGTTFRWDEVGIITLTPSVADGDYLIAGDVTGTTSGNVGRFYPDHLLLTQGTLTNRSLSVCAPVSTFTYAGEQMQIATFTLTARNGAAAPTVNYNTANSFAKFDGSIIGNFNLGAVDLADAIAPLTATALTGSLNGVSSSGSWVAGVGTFTVNLSLNRAATPDGPYESFSIGTVPTDTDGVQLNSYDVDTDLNASNDRGLIASAGKVRFGRLKLFNAHGSELLGLTIPMQAQYWNGTEFILNGNDSCTAIAAANVTMSAYQPNLTACETAVSASGNFSSGKANLQLTAPGINNNGSVDMTVNLGAIASGTTCAPGPGVAITANRPYLQGNWGGSATYDKNPTGRATFGVYKGRDEFIYLRENY